MNMDINIKKIVNAYCYETKRWQRDYFAPRLFDGIVLCSEGEIEYQFFDRKITVKKGDVLFLPGNISYSGEKKTETVGHFVIDFECFSSTEFMETIGVSVYTPNNYDVFFMKFSDVMDEWKKQNIDVTLKLKSFIYSMLSYAMKSDVKKTTTQMILDYIYENISNTSLSLKELCDIFHISESQLRRNILKHTGKKPNEYILELRLNMAKSELTYTQKSITDISVDCGFSTAYYFSRCFSRHIGMTPSKFRMLTSVI